MWYEDAARFAGKYMPWAGGYGEVEDEFHDVVRFTGLDVDARDAVALTYGGAVVAALVSAVAGFFMFVLYQTPVFFALVVIVPLLTLTYLGNYPNTYAGRYRVRVLGSMPGFISNMALSLKVIPNMEVAVDFSARRTKGPIGSALRKMVWDTYMRVYSSVDQALTEFADEWRAWNEDFARSIYFLKESMQERNEKRRIEAIERSVDTISRGTVEKMEEFVSSLDAPTMGLYFIGIIIPLVLVAVLPAVTYIGSSPVGAKAIFLVYDILLPLGILVWTRKILTKRPVTSTPVDIPSDHPGLPPEGRVTVGGINVPILPVSILVAVLISLPGILRFYQMATAEGLTGSPTYLGLDPTITIIWGMAIGAGLYLFGTTYHKEKVQREIMEVDGEFVDALVHLGNRLAENRPLEDALVQVSRVMKGSRVAEVFQRAGANLMVARMNFHGAFFDPDMGALKDIHSETIRNSMDMIIEASRKSSDAAAVAAGRIAGHLSQMRQLEKNIFQRMEEVMSSMQSTILFIGPLVGGVVVVLQRMMNTQMLKMQGSQGTEITGAPSMISSLGEAAQSTPIPVGLMQIMIGIYILFIVTILSAYMVEIHSGDDRIRKRMVVGKNILTSAVVFTLAVAVTGMII